MLSALRLWYAPELGQIVKAESRELSPLNFEVVALEREAPAPLRVTLETPANRVRVTDPRIQVTGRVSSGAGVRRVVVTLNAVEVARLEEAPPRPVIRLNVPVTLRRGQNVLLVTAEDTTGETIQEARTVFYDAATEAREARGLLAGPGPVRAQAAPPGAGLEIALVEPRDQARVDQDGVALAGLVRSGQGVSRVLVTLNGREVGRLEEPGRPRSVALNFPLTLREGRNTIVVTATDHEGTHYQEVRAVHYERVLPLTVAIRYPEDRARLTDEVTVLAAVLTSSRGVAHVAVAVNGAEVHQQTERAPQSRWRSRCR